MMTWMLDLPSIMDANGTRTLSWRRFSQAQNSKVPETAISTTLSYQETFSATLLATTS
jgi:hypothetical protein